MPPDSQARVVADAEGNWHVAWVSRNSLGGTIGKKDADLLVARSVDGGTTWTPVAALNNSATKETGPASDIGVDLGYDGGGGWVAVWVSNNTLGGTAGDDRDIFFATATDDCPTVPQAGCLVPTKAGGARLTVRDGKGGKDRLSWRWGAGQQTLLADLGDPTTSSAYALCLYDGVGGAPRLPLAQEAVVRVQLLDLENGRCWEAAYTTSRDNDAGKFKATSD